MPQQNGRTNDNGRREDTEQYGGGQSGYGAGREGEDRSMGPGYRNQSQTRSREYDDRQGVHTDDRFTGRGGEGYWEDRPERMGPARDERYREDQTDRTGYNSGYNQGGMGYGMRGGGMPRDMQGYRGSGNAGAQQADDDRRRYPDMYGPNDDYGTPGHNGRYGQGGNYQRADFEHGVGYGQGTGGRWANVPQAGMSTDWGRMQDDYRRGYGGGMQGNYGGPRQGHYRGGNIGQPGIGGHRGKGPQGFMRSDERIREMVCEALSDDDHIDATHIEVVVKNGEVILTGTVEDRRQKRLAEDCVEHLPGVRDVQNQLRCGSQGRGNQTSGSAVGRNETETSSDKKHRA